MKLHTEVRAGHVVTAASVHLREHSHQPTRNHLLQTLSTRATERASANPKLLLNSLGK